VSAGPAAGDGVSSGAAALDGHAVPDLRLSRRLPPVGVMAVTSLVLVLAAGIYLVVPVPEAAPLAPAAALLGVSFALLVSAAVMLSRVRPFAWARFFQVSRWTLLVYAIIGGVIEAVVILDGARGPMLAIATISLLLFAIAVPLNIAFTVARYADVAQAPGSP
jgi:hypothetical protein